MKLTLKAIAGLMLMAGSLTTGTASAQNPFITEIFAPDPAPLVHQNTLYVYTGHDTASVDATNYGMKDWYAFSTTDMKNWKNHGALLSPKSFSWATGDAYAAHVSERDGKFYWYVSTFHKKNEDSQGGAAMGVAVSDSPTGPFKDAIGKALIVNEMTKDQPHAWDDIDPAVFVDDNGQAYLYWGNGSLKWAKLKDNMIELDGPIHVEKIKNFIEGPWLYKLNDLYYLIYAARGPEAETIEYSISDSPEGPWKHQGQLAGSTPNSFTTHPGIVDYKGKTYFFTHNGSLPTGGSYRRSVTVDYLYFNPDGTMKKVVQTKEGVEAVR